MVTDNTQRIWRKLSKSLLLFLVLAVCGCLGQGWAGQQPAAGPSAPAKAPKKRTRKPAASASKSAPHRAATSGTKRVQKAKEPVPTPGEKETRAGLGGGGRDPFKIPSYAAGKPGQPGEGEMVSGPLPAGKRGLLISQLILEGIVRMDTTNQMIAVVTNYTKRAYFLRENDAVYNGVVSKITPDSVYFRENLLDENGRVGTRDVVKRLGPAPGEGR